MASNRRSSDSNNAEKKSDKKSSQIVGTSNSSKQDITRKREVEEIIGVTDENGELEIGIKFKGCNDMELIPARVANLEYPEHIIAYYEKRLVWETHVDAAVKEKCKKIRVPP